jgi:branched-chain amino acid transport system ATP-binding protein
VTDADPPVEPDQPVEPDEPMEIAVFEEEKTWGGHEVTPGRVLLEADELIAGYVPEVNILNGCSLTLTEGELVGIIGPNGAGKSTLLKALFGLIPVRSGTVKLRGDDITGLEAHELVSRGVGYVPQTNNVFPRLTVEENLQMGLFLRPKLFDERFGFVTGLFPLLGDRRKQRAGSLSGGERQMVAMGRALMMDPSVLLLDEPSAGLSPAYQDEVFIRCRRINDAGVSIVMVEQNARRCLQICHRGFVLDQGRNAYSGAGDDLLSDPKVIELYLGTLARAK